MKIEEFIERMAWRVRAYLPVCWSVLTEEEALASLFQAERYAARHQLPQFAESIKRQCAHTDPSGLRCANDAVTPPIYGFLVRRPNGPIYQDACHPFMGGLCAEHIGHLVVPPASWWPSEVNDELKVVLA